PRAGAHQVTFAAPVPVPDAASGDASSGALGRGNGGWFTRITIAVVVLLWLIPVAGVLITSFRPAELANSTGWWEALSKPFDSGQWTFDNYREALDTGGFENALLNSLAVSVPATVIPLTIAAFAAYAFSWMQFRGR